MNWEALAAVGQVSAAFATAWAALEAKKAAGDNARNSRLRAFLEYSEKYDEIKKRIPAGVLEGEGKQGAGQPSGAAREQIGDLIKLFEREYFLRRAGLVDDDLWEVWQRGVEKAMQRPVFLAVYREAGHDLSHHFNQWLAREVLK